MARRIQRLSKLRPTALRRGFRIVRPRRLMGEGPPKERARGRRGVLGRTIPRRRDLE